MKKAVIFYQSKTGTTKKFAREIEKFFQKQQVQTTCLPVEDYQENSVEGFDFVLLGCWTKGLMVLLQHPDEVWNRFANKLKLSGNPKIALFATYKISTGSMFKRMKKQLNGFNQNLVPQLKSRDGNLSEKDRKVLNELVTS